MKSALFPDFEWAHLLPFLRSLGLNLQLGDRQNMFYAFGLDEMPPEDAQAWCAFLRAEKPSILAMLAEEEADPAARILPKLGAEAVYTADPSIAERLVAEVIAVADGGMIGLDIETCPDSAALRRIADAETVLANLGGCALPKDDPEIKLAAARLAFECRAGLDPHRGRIRLLQLYGGGERVAALDMAHIPLSVCDALWRRPLVIHNAQFELSFLEAAGVHLTDVSCTMQAVGLVHGVERRSLAAAAEVCLGLDISKTEQVSDWSAPELTSGQISYAALDAVLARRLGEVLFPLKADLLPAYEIQMAAVLAASRMSCRGVCFDVHAHAVLVDDLQKEREAIADRFEAACHAEGLADIAEAGAPEKPDATVELLRRLLPPEEWAAWPRTAKTGRKSTRRADLRRAAAHGPIAALADLSTVDKAITAFGASLAAQVSPVTGRIHASYNVGGTNSGRVTCSAPNLQQIPHRDARFRKLFVAPPGRLLIGADYAAMEMRAAAYIAKDAALTDVFMKQLDPHRMTAARMLGIAPDQVTGEQRKAAKPVNFGSLYGMGPRGLVASAWQNYGLVFTLGQAEGFLDAFARAYPDVERWRRRHADCCRDRGSIRIGKDADKNVGRLFRFAQNTKPERREFWFPQACNLPIQGACADASMLALALIDEALREHGITGGAVIWCHDEIVLEVPERDGERAAVLLDEAMTLAFGHIFPGAPLAGLVSVHTGRSWEETK